MKRTMYSMYHQVAGYGQLGRMCVSMCQEVAPGDTWSGKNGVLVRLSPLKRALLQDIWVDQYVFYIPHRLVYADWENFIAEGPTTTPTYTLPKHTVSDTGAGAQRQLWYNQDSSGTPTSIDYSAMRLYAYNLVFNEFFRDEDEAAVAPGYTLIHGNAVNYKKDYWSNLQENIVSPDGHSAPVVGNAVDATEILRAIAQQKVAMKRATYGTRYVDILKSYGVSVNYQMLQRPEVVAMSRGSINVTDVVGTDSTNLGQMAGHGISGTRLRLRRKSFPEHGTLLGILVLRPNYTDTEFCDWFDKPRQYDSFYDPGLVPLPAVEVKTGDVVNQFGTASSYGYQPWGQWYRRGLSRTQSGLEEWVGNVKPALAATNKEALTKIDPGNYEELFQDTSFQHFQFSVVNKMRAARLIPRPRNPVITGVSG